MEPHLKVYKDRSVLFLEEGKEEVFFEGKPNEDAEKRLDFLKENFDNGFLENIYVEIKRIELEIDFEEEITTLFDNLVSNVTSQYGRSLVGLSFLQLCIKSIEPRQSIRVHKGGRGDFSWVDGIPMRSLDATYIAPFLRKENLLKYNKFGVMMTRSLAENYPYSEFYKASLRGSKETWLRIVELLESNKLDPKDGLKYLMSLLINRSEEFESLAKETLELMSDYIEKENDSQKIKNIIFEHISQSDYPARLFEIALHSIFQELSKENVLGGTLRPISQMRSANKKFGNIGDVEVITHPDSDDVIEAWDAKYGKPYLYDELGEIDDKLGENEELIRVGFVVESEPLIKKDIIERMEYLYLKYGIEIEILSLNDWVDEQYSRSKSNSIDLSKKWLEAYTETLCQRRRKIAPIDEPCKKWIEELKEIIRTK